MHRRRPIIAASVTAVCAFVLLASGCGGGEASPGVASVAASTTTAGTPTTAQSPSGSAGQFGGPAGGRGSQFQLSMRVSAADGPKYSACMRKQGVTNFPDPNGQGVITIHSGMGIDPGSPAFTSARATCAKLLPNGGRPTPAQIAQQQQQMLALSACMRAHGLKDFPDPSNGGLEIQTHPGSDLNPDNPTFQKAQQACQKYAPIKGGSVKAGSG
jgi:hypothetical protein